MRQLAPPVSLPSYDPNNNRNDDVRDSINLYHGERVLIPIYSPFYIGNIRISRTPSSPVDRRYYPAKTLEYGKDYVFSGYHNKVSYDTGLQTALYIILLDEPPTQIGKYEIEYVNYYINFRSALGEYGSINETTTRMLKALRELTVEKKKDHHYLMNFIKAYQGPIIDIDIDAASSISGITYELDRLNDKITDLKKYLKDGPHPNDILLKLTKGRTKGDSRYQLDDTITYYNVNRIYYESKVAITHRLRGVYVTNKYQDKFRLIAQMMNTGTINTTIAQFHEIYFTVYLVTNVENDYATINVENIDNRSKVRIRLKYDSANGELFTSFFINGTETHISKHHYTNANFNYYRNIVEMVGMLVYLDRSKKSLVCSLGFYKDEYVMTHINIDTVLGLGCEIDVTSTNKQWYLELN